jgi:hypothetical protein
MCDSSGRVISPTHRPLPDNTQHSQKTDIYAPGGIRTHNPKRAAADPRLIPRGHWNRFLNTHEYKTNCKPFCTSTLTDSRVILEKLRVRQLVKNFFFTVWKLEVHSCVHKISPHAPILCQTNPVYTHILFLEDHFNIIITSKPCS